jgi:hypothetical protein
MDSASKESVTKTSATRDLVTWDSLTWESVTWDSVPLLLFYVVVLPMETRKVKLLLLSMTCSQQNFDNLYNQ